MVALLGFGAAWGLTQPLAKIATTGGWGPFGIVAWQMTLAVAITVPLAASRGGLRFGGRDWSIAAQVAVLGTLLPNAASYGAITGLPSGVASIVLATVPVFAYPIALAMGRERASTRRLLGLTLGMAAMVVVASARGLGEGAIPPAFVALGLLAPLCYALNSNLLAGLDVAPDPIRLMAAASVLGAPLAWIVALVLGQAQGLTATGADAAMLAASSIHVAVYIGFLWLIGRAGAVFASMTAWAVTGFGVLWAMVLLAERYPPRVWAGLALLVLALALVRPRRPHANRRMAAA